MSSHLIAGLCLAIGVAAATFKLFAPWNEAHSVAASAEELVGAALAFALLCGLAAVLRNFIVRKLVGPEIE